MKYFFLLVINLFPIGLFAQADSLANAPYYRLKNRGDQYLSLSSSTKNSVMYDTAMYNYLGALQYSNDAASFGTLTNLIGGTLKSWQNHTNETLMEVKMQANSLDEQNKKLNQKNDSLKLQNTIINNERATSEKQKNIAEAQWFANIAREVIKKKDGFVLAIKAHNKLIAKNEDIPITILKPLSDAVYYKFRQPYFKEHTTAISTIDIDHEQSLMVTSDRNNKLWGWTFNDSLLLQSTPIGDNLSFGSIAGSSHNFAAIHNQQNIILFNKDGQRIDTLLSNNPNITKIISSKNRHFLVSASDDGIANLWRSADLIKKSFAHGEEINELLVSADNKYLITISSTNIKIWDTSNSSKYITSFDHKGFIFSTHLTKDYLFSGGAGGKIFSWNLKEQQLDSMQLNKKIKYIRPVPNSNLLFAFQHDGTISLVNLVSKQLVKNLKLENDGTIRSTMKLVHSSKSNSFLFINGKTIHELGYKDSVSLRNFGNHKGEILDLTLSEDSNYLFSSDEKGYLKQWNITTRETLMDVQPIDKEAPLNHIVLGKQDKVVLSFFTNGIIVVGNTFISALAEAAKYQENDLEISENTKAIYHIEE